MVMMDDKPTSNADPPANDTLLDELHRVERDGEVRITEARARRGIAIEPAAPGVLVYDDRVRRPRLLRQVDLPRGGQPVEACSFVASAEHPRDRRLSARPANLLKPFRPDRSPRHRE